MGMETGGVNEQYANVMREQIPALFEYHSSFENVEA
jgi:hypothetical protein